MKIVGLVMRMLSILVNNTIGIVLSQMLSNSTNRLLLLLTGGCSLNVVMRFASMNSSHPSTTHFTCNVCVVGVLLHLLLMSVVVMVTVTCVESLAMRASKFEIGAKADAGTTRVVTAIPTLGRVCPPVTFRGSNSD